MTFEKFKEFYKKFGRCPNDLSVRKNPLSEKQLLSRFEKFERSQQKKLEKAKEDSTDVRWEELKEIIQKRDGTSCRLISFLKAEKKDRSLEELREKAGHLIYIIDHAHVIRRSVAPNLKYNPDNIILLNRYSHGNLDSYRDPITGMRISKEDVEQWWKFLIGSENFQKLQEKL